MKSYYLLSFSVMAILFVGSCSNNQSTQKQPLYSYSIDDRLTELGIELENLKPSQHVFVNAVRSGNLIFMSGKVSKKQDGTLITGKLGQDLSVDEGKEAARLTAIQQLEGLKAEIGDLNKVVRIVKVLGMVNSSPDFTQQPAVINGFSDLMIQVFGDRGKHARSAVGMATLPSNVAVEVEMIVEVVE